LNDFFMIYENYLSPCCRLAGSFFANIPIARN
jgi:hypothetical protein